MLQKSHKRRNLALATCYKMLIILKLQKGSMHIAKTIQRMSCTRGISLNFWRSVSCCWKYGRVSFEWCHEYKKRSTPKWFKSFYLTWIRKSCQHIRRMNHRSRVQFTTLLCHQIYTRFNVGKFVSVQNSIPPWKPRNRWQQTKTATLIAYWDPGLGTLLLHLSVASASTLIAM